MEFTKKYFLFNGTKRKKKKRPSSSVDLSSSIFHTAPPKLEEHIDRIRMSKSINILNFVLCKLIDLVDTKSSTTGISSFNNTSIKNYIDPNIM